MLEDDLEAQLLALGHTIGVQDPLGWLQGRWQYLDEVSPQLVLVDADQLRTAGGRGLAWVPADLIAHVDDGGWGEVNTRPGTYLRIMNALVAADATSIKDWIHDVGHPPLLEVAGPYGPLYQAGGDGRHRTAILKALGVQWQYDVLPERGLEVGEQFLVMVNAVIPAHLLQERRLHDQAVSGQLEHLELLTKAGLINLVGRTHRFENRAYMVGAPLPFPWALKQPAAVAAASRRYKQSYRHFGTTEAERASLDAGSWSTYLAGLADRAAVALSPLQEPLARLGAQAVEESGPAPILA